ncbi:MAG TPA: YsnF/AvaK domain-containing protein [Terriglobales bacterium]|nr:YsnF/AvaK domain-containing protein [Terriglobales bacterium]
MMDPKNLGRNTRDVGVAGPGTVAAVFKDHTTAERAASDLVSAGFTRNDIGIAICEPEGRKVDEGWVSRVRDMFSGEEREQYSSTDAPGTLRQMGISDDRMSHFERAMHEGDVLVTVRAGSRQDQALAILNRHGGDLGLSSRDTARTGTNVAGNLREMPERRLQLFGEMLRVHKERVQRGEVRLRKEVVSEQKTVDVPVMREEVVIERVAGDRAQPAGSADFGTDKEIRVPLSEERVQVEKTPVVNEEIRVGKRQIQEVRQVSDTVRHEEVRIDNEGDVNVSEGDRDRDIRRDDVRRPGKDKKIA